MADVIDEKVVSMQFDNKEFEKNVAESLKSIQELKKSLDFDASTKNLEGLAQASKRFKFDGIAGAIDEVKNGFSAMEIAGVTAFANLVNSAVNAGKRMVSALTIDPVKQGFGVYESKMNTVMTIMNNSGKSLEETMEILNELNEYSDKTIYSLNDMTNALGKFTAQGVDARKAVDIIKGAANEAATMGAGSEQFSRMIYNLTQAFGMGKMLTIDWRSLENANVAGAKFKQTLIDSYEELAKMGKVTDKFVGKVTIKNLRDMLREGIITSEVMEDAFLKYAGMKEGFEDFGQAAENAAKQVKTFHQLLDVLKESVASQWSHAWGYVIGDFNEAKRLWSTVNVIFDNTVGALVKNRVELLRLWHEGFTDPETGKQISGRMLLMEGLANIFLTLRQIIKPIKEAFRELFPEKTAKNLWETTKAFRDFTARLRLSEAAMKQIKDAAGGFFSILKFIRTAIKDVLAAIFPATKGVDSLLSVILGLAGALGRSVKSFLTTIQTSEAYASTINAIGKAAIVLIKILVVLARTVYNLAKAAKEVGLFQKIFNLLTRGVLGLVNVIMTYGPKVLDIVGSIAEVLVGVAGLIFGGVASGINFFKNLFSKKDGKDAAKSVDGVMQSVSKLSGDQMTENGENVTRGFGAGILAGMAGLLQIVGKVFTSVITFVQKIFGIESPAKVFIAIGAFCLAGFLLGITNSGILGQIKSAISNIANNTIVSGFVDVLKRGFNSIKSAISIDGIKELFATIENSLKSLGDSSVSVGDRISNFFSLVIQGFQKINFAAVILAGVIGGSMIAVIKLLMVAVNVTRFMSEAGGGFRKIATGFNNFAKAAKNMSKAFWRAQNPIVQSLFGISAAIFAITSALVILSQVKDNDGLTMTLGILLTAVGGIFAILVAFSSWIKVNMLEESIKSLTSAIAAVGAGMVLLAAAFGIIVYTISSINGNYEAIGIAAAVFTGLILILTGLTLAMSKINMKSGVKAALMMISYAIVLGAVVKAFNSLTLLNSNKLTVAIQALFATTIAVGLLCVAVSRVKLTSLLTLLGITRIIKVITESVNLIDYRATLKCLDKYKNIIAVIGTIALLMMTLSSLLGKGIKNFGYGILALASSVLVLAGAVALFSNIGGDWDSLKMVSALLLEVGVLAGVMIAVVAIAKPPKKSVDQFAKLLTSMALVLLAAAGACVIVERGGVSTERIYAIAAMLGGLILATSVLVLAAKKSKGVKLGRISGVVFSLTLLVGAMAILAKVFDSVGEDSIIGVITAIGVTMGLLLGITIALNGVGKDVAKPLRALSATLLILTGSLVLLSLVPTDKLISAMEAIAISLLSVFLIVSAMGRIKKDALGPAIVGVVMILSIAASLAVLAKICDWQATLAAAGAMSATMVAVAIALRIISSATKATNIIAAAASITIAAAGLFVLAYALKQFEGMDFDRSIGVAAASFGVLAAGLALLGAVGVAVLAGAGAILIAAVGLIVLAQALREYEGIKVDWQNLLTIAGCLAALGIAGVVLGVGSLGLITGSAGLLILSKALVNFSKAEIGGGYLSGLAGSLALMGLAGVVLGVGSTGLLIGSIAILALSGALAVMQLLNFKTLSKKNLKGLASGLFSIAGAGIVGAIGGPGLLALSVGLTALSGSLWLVSKALVALYDVMEFFSSDTAETLGENTIAGYQNGVAKSAPTMLTAVGGVFTSLISGICNILGIHSPSEVLRKIGEFTGWGFLEGWANSDLVQKLDSASKTIATDGILNPIAETLSNGFGDIGDVFKSLDIFGNSNKEINEQIKKEEDLISQLTTKMRIARANGNSSLVAKLSQDIGRVEVRIAHLKEQLSDNELLSGLGSDWGSIFDGLQDALSGLQIEFPELTDILGQTGDETNLLAMDLSSLEGAMGDVTDASATTTKSFEQNIDIFSAFDRALKTTVTEIESNMIDRLLGTDQWTKYLKNMHEAWGYDEGFVKMIADMGMDQGYAFAAAFDAAGSDEAYVQWINQIWKDKDLYEDNLNDFLATLEAGAKSTRDTTKAIVTEDKRTGEYMMVNGGHTNDALMTTLLGGDAEKAQSDASAQYYAAKKQLNEEIDKINSESDKNSIAAAESNDSAADAMMSEMSDAIKRAIDKYLPANAFVPIGENICKGLAAGIFKYKGQVVSDTVLFANTLIEAVESAFGIASPSKVFKRIGEYCTEGLAIGLEDTTGAEKSTAELGKSLLDQLQIQLAKIQALLEGDDVWTPTIRPVVDLSNVATSAEQARLMFDSSQVEAASNDLANYRLMSVAPENTLAGMSREEFTRFMNQFANAVLDGIESSDKEVNVNVYLEGDSKGIFKVVRTENQVFKRATGYSALT